MAKAYDLDDQTEIMQRQSKWALYEASKSIGFTNDYTMLFLTYSVKG